MELQNQFFEYFKNIIHYHSIISISGESATGKTSFALYLVGNILDDSTCGIWIQASEQFPRRRLKSMFQNNQNLLHNIYITPPKPFISYSEQFIFFSTFNKNKMTFPPHLKVIVIDNISHHLRYALSKKMEIQEKITLLDKFYEYSVYPLIVKCQREQISLILIHEVSFDVKSQATRPFFYKLYDRIKSLQIMLKKSLFSDKRTMDVNTGKKSTSFAFKMRENGFYFI